MRKKGVYKKNFLAGLMAAVMAMSPMSAMAVNAETVSEGSDAANELEAGNDSGGVDPLDLEDGSEVTQDLEESTKEPEVEVISASMPEDLKYDLEAGSKLSLDNKDIFGESIVKRKLVTTPGDWKWMVTPGTEGTVSSEAVDGFKSGYVIYLGDYDLTDVEAVTVNLGLNKGRTIKGKIETDCEADLSEALLNEAITNSLSTGFQVYSGGVWDVHEGNVLYEFRTEGVSDNWEQADYTYELTTKAQGVHPLYYRIYSVMNTWAGGLYSVTMQTGEVSVDGGSNMSITSVSKDGEVISDIASMGISVEEDQFVWDTESVSDIKAGEYQITFSASAPDDIEVSQTMTVQVSEPEKIGEYSTKRGQNFSLTNSDIFGVTTEVYETVTTPNDWKWMVTPGTEGTVSSESVDGFKSGYVIYLGDYDLTDVESITVKLGLNTGRTIKGKIETDCDANLTDASINEAITNSLSTGFQVYSGGVWDVPEGNVLYEFRTEGVSDNWEQADYTYELSTKVEGVHPLYYRVYSVMNTWAGGLYSVDLTKKKSTIGGTGMSIQSVSRDGVPIADYAALGMSVEDDIFTWKTLHLSNEQAGTYLIKFSAVDESNVSVQKQISVNVEKSVNNYSHPGLMFTEEQINTMYQNYQRGLEPWKSAGDEVLKVACKSYDLQGYQRVIDEGNTIWTDTKSVVDGMGFNNAFRADCQVAYQNILAYLLTHENGYAEVSMNILNAYSKLKPSIDGHDKEFVAAQMAFRLCNVAELLRYAYVDTNGNSVWKTEDILLFQEWMIDEFVPLIDTYGMANGGVGDLKGMLAIGIFCDNDFCYDFAINGYKNDENCSVTGAINEFGQTVEAGRDQTHAQLILGHFSEVAWVAYNQGLDLFSYEDHRLLKGYEYMAKYMMGEEVPYDKDFYSTNYVYSNVISDGNRGYLLPMFEFIYNYYVGIKGWNEEELPYTSKAVAFTRNEGVECYNGGYDTYHLIGWGTLSSAVLSCPAQVDGSSVKVTAGSGGTATIEWNASNGAAGYYIYRSNAKVTSEDPVAYPMAWYDRVNEEPVTGISYLDSNLVAGEGYFYKITAVDQKGTEAGCCAPVYVKGLEEAPTKAPESVYTAVVSDDIMKISWTSVSGAAGYHVFVSMDGGKNFTQLNKEMITDTFCYHLGFQPGVQYVYKVQAVNNYGQSELSDAYGCRTASDNASGEGIGTIGIYPVTINLAADADVSIQEDGTVTAGDTTNECSNPSRVSYLRFDLNSLGLGSGAEIADARLMIYRSGSTSPIAVYMVESEENDYDDWGETLAEDGINLESFRQGNLKFDIEESALTYLESGAKPSNKGSYNSSDGVGVNITDAARQQALDDGVLTLRVVATGTGGSSNMSFYSRHAGNDYVPVMKVRIENPVIESYEAEEHEQIEEEQINSSGTETDPVPDPAPNPEPIPVKNIVKQMIRHIIQELRRILF